MPPLGLNRAVRSSNAYRIARAQMFAMYGDVCHLCGHEGAGEADHLESLKDNPGQQISPHTMRPAHGTSSPCPVCVDHKGMPRQCNQVRGARPVAGPLITSEDW